MLLSSSCFLFKQKTAYEMRISDWSSDVCSSDLHTRRLAAATQPIHPNTAIRIEHDFADVWIIQGFDDGRAERRAQHLHTTLARGGFAGVGVTHHQLPRQADRPANRPVRPGCRDRKSTRLNSSH